MPYSITISTIQQKLSLIEVLDTQLILVKIKINKLNCSREPIVSRAYLVLFGIAKPHYLPLKRLSHLIYFLYSITIIIIFTKGWVNRDILQIEVIQNML